MFIIRMNSGARSAGGGVTKGEVRVMVVGMFVQGVDTTGAPRVEASLQASLIHTSASLVSAPHRDPFSVAESPALFSSNGAGCLTLSHRPVVICYDRSE
jgi:hypothetical protein